MSAIVHQDYAAAPDGSGSAWARALPLKRLIITVSGCALMAISGTGLANYLDTSAVTGADAAPVDSASLN